MSLHSSLHGSNPIQLSLGHNPIRYRKIQTISCKAVSSNYYQVLSLDSENASFDEIKKAYRLKALVYHPDVCPQSKKEEFARLFIELHKAYEILSDPILRKNYDHELGLMRAGNDQSRWLFLRATWENQLSGLKMRSDRRLQRKERDSWGSRMRAERRFA